MKAPTYTDEQIIEAGMQLLAENKRVSPFAIRTLMGGGNPKRIKKIWAESQQGALEGQIVREQVDLPTEFEEALHATKHSLDELAKRMYNHAQEIAESRVRETITAARKAKEAADTEVTEAMDAVNKLDDDNRSLQQQLEKTWNERQQANTESNLLKQRIETLTNNVKKEREALQVANTHNTQIQRINTQLELKTALAEKTLADKDNKLQVSRKAEEVAKIEAAELKGKLKVLEAQALAVKT